MNTLVIFIVALFCYAVADCVAANLYERWKFRRKRK